MVRIDGDLFRKEIKAAGLKGVTVRNKHYNFFVFTIKFSENDYLPFDMINHKPAGLWYDRNSFFDMDAAGQAAALASEKQEYFEYILLGGYDFTHRRGRDVLSAAGLAKIEKLENIIYKYHVSDTDSMHDIFNDNFYFAIVNK